MTYPNYFNQYQTPMLSNQQLRLNQMEQMFPQFASPQQMQQPQSTLSGRLIDDISTVTANEVPMTGDYAVFPKKDMSEVYVRQWQNDGTIRTLKFVPVENEPNNSTLDKFETHTDALSEFRDVLEKRLDDFNKRFDKLESLITPKQTNQRAKKETES